MTVRWFGVTSRIFHYTHSMGRFSFGGSGFMHPMDVAVGQNGLLYVANSSRQGRPDGVRITMCTVDQDYVSEFGSFGEGDSQFIWPMGIALDGDENVYVSDQWLNRISVFNKDGEFLSKWGVAGMGDGELGQPSGIAFDGEDNLLVVDTNNNRVQKFTKDGRLLANWGEAGSGPGQFNLPWGIAVDDKGDVYVADWRNDRIQKFSAEGEYLAEFGSSGSGVGQFNRPADVAVDKEGDIYVVDGWNNRVQVLAPDGRHVTTFIGDATVSKWYQESLDANPELVKVRQLVRNNESEMRFWNPVAVEIDPDGRVLVVDCPRHRIQFYQKDNY